MTEQHPTTLPPELVQQWENAWYAAKVKHESLNECVATQAARWGYEQAVTELETCLRDYPMTEQHPITPPPELVEDWIEIAKPLPQRPPNPGDLADLAARWGADQELEACCEWLCDVNRWKTVADRMRTARRPKPPSLKEQALQAAQRFYANGHEDCNDEEVKDDFDIIRRALESLPS